MSMRKLLLGLLSSFALFPIAADAQVISQYSFVRAKHSNKCLHVNGDQGLGNGVPVTQWQCVNQNNVKWQLVPVPGEVGYYFFKVKFSDKCAQVNGLSQQNGAAITQWDCVNQDNVKWRLAPAGDGYYYLIAKHSNKCLQVNELSQANGAPITQWDCVDQPNVQWKLQSI
jgi:hypothetical protein